MASPITIGGVQVLAADQGDTFAWGAAIKAALAQVASTCLQTTGGSFPLAADLNLGSNFGLIAQYLALGGGLIPTSGQLRMANTSAIVWAQNSGPGTVNFLGPGGAAALTGALDELVYSKNGSVSRITGNPGVYATTTAGQLVTNNATTTVVYGTEIVDTDAAFNPATGIFTCPTGKGGPYICTAAATIAMPSATSCQFTGLFVVNGTGRTQQGDTALTVGGAAAVAPCWGSAVIFLNPGDQLAFGVFQNSAANRNLTVAAVENFFAIKGLVV